LATRLVKWLEKSESEQAVTSATLPHISPQIPAGATERMGW